MPADKKEESTHLRTELKNCNWYFLLMLLGFLPPGFILSIIEIIYQLTHKLEIVEGTIIPYPVYWVVGGLTVLILEVGVYIHYQALKQYLHVLENNKLDEVVACGRIYYSIERKSFLGLDGQAYTLEDDKQIEEDIETYSSLNDNI